MGITGLGPVAKEPIGAHAVVGKMVHALVDFAARVDRASDAIVDDGRCARLAVEQGIAGLRTVTKEPVVAETVLGQMLDEIPLFVAGVLGASHAVARRRWHSGTAPVEWMTDLGSVAKRAVTASCVVRRVNHHLERFVALIDRTGQVVDRIGRRARDALLVHTGLRPVAKESVVAVIVARAGGPGNAVFEQTTELGRQASLVVRVELTFAGAFDTRIRGACDLVVTNYRFSGGALIVDARLEAIAEKPVVAVCVVVGVASRLGITMSMVFRDAGYKGRT